MVMDSRTQLTTGRMSRAALNLTDISPQTAELAMPPNWGTVPHEYAVEYTVR